MARGEGEKEEHEGHAKTYKREDYNEARPGYEIVSLIKLRERGVHPFRHATIIVAAIRPLRGGVCWNVS